MILFQFIAIELFQYSNDYPFAQFLINTFICPVYDLSSFKYAKEKCRITKKHTFMPFQEEWSSAALFLNEWVVSFAFLIFPPLPWNVHPQIKVVNRGLSQVHPPPLTAESTGSICGPIHVNESRRKRKCKEGPSPTLAIWTLLHSHVPIFNNSYCRSLCKWEWKPKRVVFLMLHIDNPHPHKENKFLFI